MDHEKLGIDLARACKWDLEDLRAVMLQALVEANFHSLAIRFDMLVDDELRMGSENDLPV